MTLSAKTEFCVDLREFSHPSGHRIHLISERIDKRLREMAERKDSKYGLVARAYMEHIKKAPGTTVELWLNLEASPH